MVTTTSLGNDSIQGNEKNPMLLINLDQTIPSLLQECYRIYCEGGSISVINRHLKNLIHHKKLRPNEY